MHVKVYPNVNIYPSHKGKISMKCIRLEVGKQSPFAIHFASEKTMESGISEPEMREALQPSSSLICQSRGNSADWPGGLAISRKLVALIG
jgi:hypothetical protein